MLKLTIKIKNPKKKVKHHGFSLLEILIATVILAIGLLGIVVAEHKAMLVSCDSSNTATANMLIQEIIARMQSNNLEAQKETTSTYIKSHTSINATLNGFDTISGDDNSSDTSALNTLLGDTGCTYSAHTSCDSTKIAARDIFEWKFELLSMLPSGAGVICLDSVPSTNNSSFTCDGTNPGRSPQSGFIKSVVYTIKVRWTDSSNTTRYIMQQSVFPCGSGACS